jgi:TolB-like protein
MTSNQDDGAHRHEARRAASAALYVAFDAATTSDASVQAGGHDPSGPLGALDAAAFARCVAATQLAKRLSEDPDLEWAYADAAALARPQPATARRGVRYALGAAAAALVSMALWLGTAPPQPVVDSDASAPSPAEPELAAAVERATALLGAAQAANPVALLPGDVVVDAHSIAVLPFTPAGDGAEADAADLAARVERDLIATLSAIPGMYAIGDVSARAYAGAELPPSAIGAQLGVRGIVTGRIAVTADRIQITAVLRDATTNAVLWRNDYDDALAALSSIQGDIVEAVTAALVDTPRYEAAVAALARHY